MVKWMPRVHRALSSCSTRSRSYATIATRNKLQELFSRYTSKSPHCDLIYTTCIMANQPLYGARCWYYTLPYNDHTYKQPNPRGVLGEKVCTTRCIANITSRHCTNISYRLVVGHRPNIADITSLLHALQFSKLVQSEHTITTNGLTSIY